MCVIVSAHQLKTTVSAEWRELRVSEANRRQKGKRKDLLNKTAAKEERRREEKEEE